MGCVTIAGKTILPPNSVFALRTHPAPPGLAPPLPGIGAVALDGSESRRVDLSPARLAKLGMGLLLPTSNGFHGAPQRSVQVLTPGPCE